MNILPVISACAGLAIMVAVVVVGNKLKNRWLRYLSVAVGLILALVVTGSIPLLFGVDDVKASAKAGEYMVYLGIVLVIIKSAFFKGKKDEDHSG